MKIQLTMLACAVALVGCTGQAPRERLGIEDPTVLKTGLGAVQTEAAGAPTAQWVNTYAPIKDRSVALTNLQQRLDRLPADQSPYFHSKAQCWIDAGRQETKANDQWGFVEEAIGQAASITASLETSVPLSAANPELRTVSMVRPDLWKIINVIKSDPATARCPEAQKQLACGEVELMRAGHYAWTRNFKAAEGALPAIQNTLQKSAQLALQCAAQKPTSAAVARRITLRADSAFRFDGGDQAAMLPGGIAQLDSVVAGLKQTDGIRQLNINGYTDRLGSDAYNDALSLRRAQTVQDYLRKHGVTLPITVQGRGKSNPQVQCAQKKREDLIQCLAPNRRVEIDFLGGTQ